MFKSLHHSFTRAMCLVIALIAHFAVGMAAPDAVASTPPPVADGTSYISSTGAEPAVEVPFDLARIDQLPGIDPACGLLIKFDEPICGARGPLSHGSPVWADEMPEGFSFVVSTAVGTTETGNVWYRVAQAYRDDQAHVYGLFIPIASRENQNFPAGQYSITIPAGSLFFADDRENEEVTYTWNFIKTEPEGTFAIVSPQAGRPLRSISQLEVASMITTHLIGISSVSERVCISLFDFNTQKTHTVWASGSLVGDRVVFTLDEMLTAETEDYITFTIPAGAFTTTTGLSNGDITGTLTLNSNFTTTLPVSTYPLSDAPADIEAFRSTHFANDCPGFLVNYDTAPVAATPDGHLWTNMPDGFSFTYTYPGTSDIIDMSWRWENAVVYNPDANTMALCLPMAESFPISGVYEGTYRLVVPEASFQLQDGTYNAAIDYTWTLAEILPYFWIRGGTTPAQQVPNPVFSTITLISVDPLGDLGQNQSMSIFMVDSTNKNEYINGTYAPKSVTLSTNAEGQSALTIELPDDVVAAMSSNNNEKIIEINLPGYTADDNAAGLSPDQCFVKNAAGLPNAPITYYFAVNPLTTYTYTFSFTYAPTTDYSVTIDGRTERPNEEGVVSFPNINRLLTADDVTINGISEGIIYHFGNPMYVLDTNILHVNVDLMLDVDPRVMSLTSGGVAIEYPTGSISYDKLPGTSTPFSFLFDREIDSSSVTLQSFAEHASVSDLMGRSYGIGWFNTGGNWMDFGLNNWDTPIPVGTYIFHIDENTIRFVDGKWNPAIDFSITVTGVPTFEYTDYAAASMTFEGNLIIDQTIQELNRPLTSFALAYNPQCYNFNGNGPRDVEVTVYSDLYEHGTIFTATAFPQCDAQGKNWLVFYFPTADPTYSVTLASSGNATIQIAAGAFCDDNLAENEEITLWFNIVDYYVVDIYVDGTPSDLYLLRYSKNGDKETLYEARNGDHILKSDFGAYVTTPAGELGKLFKYESASFDDTNHIRFDYTFIGTDQYYLAGYNINGNAGLSAATLAFGQELNPLYFRKRIEWSEGFKLKRKLTHRDFPLELEAETDIEYATIDVEGKNLILRFYDHEGNEFYPLEAGPTYYLEIPMHSLFAYHEALGGFANEVPGCTPLRLTYEFSFKLRTIEEMLILTDEDEANHTINLTPSSKVNGLADILVGKVRGAANASNDITGDGNLTIADITRLIRQATQRVVPDDNGDNGDNGEESTGNGYPEGWHPVAIGTPDDPGQEAL